MDEELIERNKRATKESGMMKDIGEFFRDSANLSRVWNLVKAINTSDQIKSSETSKKNVEQLEAETADGKRGQSDEGTTALRNKYPSTGNRAGIDVSRLQRGHNSETTLYNSSYTPGWVPISDESEVQDTSAEVVSSDEGISPIDFSDPRSRVPPPELLPLPPPPPRDDQPSTSKGWAGGANERQRRTKEAAQKQLSQAKADKIGAAKPPGKTQDQDFSSSAEQARIVGEAVSQLQHRDSDLSLLVENINSLTAEGEFDPLTVQLDGLTLDKIERGAYVDLRKLLPKETLGDDEDEDELHWVMQGGTPKLRKKSAGEILNINGYRRWMTAFSAYSRIYVKSNPQRGPETHQYLLDIQDAANTYTWDSVYAYDKIFQMYMEKNPKHDWGAPYAKYWNKILKKKDREPGANFPGGQRQKRKVCWKFNKHGHCDNGKNCDFDHRCSVCGRYGHSKINCYHNRDNDRKDRDYKKPLTRDKESKNQDRK